ncbi:MAG TPA: LytTR family transcriptional regulator [Bacteroidetes bacterium]|nr:LytTR family transcriptional regulator [Bacteroidota bacterium]
MIEPIKSLPFTKEPALIKRLPGLATGRYKNINCHYSQKLIVNTGKQIKVIEMDDVAYFYTESKITFLMTHTGKRYPIDFSLNHIEKMADPKTFFRINRQFVINMQAIKKMWRHPKSRIKVTLASSSDIEVIVSTVRTPVFKKWLIGESD